jgi:O-antigen/teichoic acid export membrane protein
MKHYAPALRRDSMHNRQHQEVIHHSFTSKILHGLQWAYVSVVAQGVLKLAVLVVLARVLTPRDFGLLGFALICTNFVERVGQLGVTPALVQCEVVSVNTITTARLMSVGLGFLTGTLVYLTAGFMARFFDEPTLKVILEVLSVGCILEALAATPDALLQRDLQFKRIMVADTVSYFVGMGIVGIALALAGWGVWALVTATLWMKGIRLLIMRLYVGRTCGGSWSWNESAQLLSMGFGFSLGRLLNFFSLQGDNFVVGRLLGVEALGFYTRAYQLMTLPAMYIGQVFEKVMFPAMAQEQRNLVRLQRSFLLTLEAVGVVALPAGVCLYLLAEEIVIVGFGERWRPIIPVLQILSFGVFFRTAYKCSDIVVRSVGAVYRYAQCQAWYSVMVIGGAVLGAMAWELRGVAIGVVVAVALNYASMTRLSSRVIGTSGRALLGAHLLGVWVSIPLVIVLRGVLPWIMDGGEPSITVLAVAVVISGLVWCGALGIAIVICDYGLAGLLRGFICRAFARIWTPQLADSPRP